MNPWDQVREAVRAGKQMQDAVNSNAAAMGALLKHQLLASEMPHHVLKAFKDELRYYNVHTQRWRR